MNKFKNFFALVLAMATALCLTGCETYDNFKKAFIDPADPEAIKVGVFEPLSGTDAEGAKLEIRGIELAHEMFPSVNGNDVELIYADNQSDAELAVNAAEELVASGVVASIGSYNNVLSLAGGDVFEEARIPAIAATNSNPLVTNTNDYYFRVCSVEAYQGVSAAKYVFDCMGCGRVVAFKMEGDDYAATMIEQFENEMIALTGSDDSVIVVDYPENGEDYESYIKILAMAGRSTVFFPSKASVAAKVIKAAADAGYRFEWIGPSRWSELGAQLGYSDYSFLDGAVYVTDYDPDTELSEMAVKFKNAWARKYGEADVPSKEAALGFDAYLLALNALEAADGEYEGFRLRKYIASVKSMSGATGTVTMGASGDPTTDVVIAQYKDGSASAIYTIKAVTEAIGD